MVQITEHVLWLICVLTINIQGQKANPCLPEQYYDGGLKECFYCIDLCHKAKARGQLSECQEKCPGYMTTSTTSLNTPTPYEDTTYASTTLTISESYESTAFPTTTLNTSRSNESTTQPSPVASGSVQGWITDHSLELGVVGIIFICVILCVICVLSVILCRKKPERITARVEGCTAVQETQPPRSSQECLMLITNL